MAISRWWRSEAACGEHWPPGVPDAMERGWPVSVCLHGNYGPDLPSRFGHRTACALECATPRRFSGDSVSRAGDPDPGWPRLRVHADPWPDRPLPDRAAALSLVRVASHLVGAPCGTANRVADQRLETTRLSSLLGTKITFRISPPST